MTTTTPAMSAGEALDIIGIDEHDHEMRIKFQECFVCGGPVNFMRLYTERKLYCPRHDGATGELAEAIRVLNHA
jgi:hypothetical protein